jgi:hypothetical protein
MTPTAKKRIGSSGSWSEISEVLAANLYLRPKGPGDGLRTERARITRGGDFPRTMESAAPPLIPSLWRIEFDRNKRV